MRKYKPVVLPLRPVPPAYYHQEADCPNCESRSEEVLGRLGLRLVFRCTNCKVRFFRLQETRPGVLV
jgi:DNA-directed RNA polymerase subunit RPC12/RpoP